MQCLFTFRNGKKCSNRSIFGSNYCHLEIHHPSKEEYSKLFAIKFDEFISDRIPVSNFKIVEVEGDGACLFRCLSNAIFKKCNNNINLVIEIFQKTGFHNNPNFLKDYLDISECFTSEEYQLDSDLEEEISRAIQLIIVNYVRENSNMKIMLDMSVEEIIMLCHNLDLDTYLKNYSQFAGDDDYIIEKIEKNGKMKSRKVEIDDRWGGIPELKIFCILFNFDIVIYTPQKFDKIYMKPTEATKLRKNIYLKEIEKIESEQPNPYNYKLLLRYFKKGNHYDFLL